MPFEKGNKLGKLKGKHVKSKMWEELGASMTEEWSEKIKEYGNSLIDDGDLKEFKNLYLDLLNYFKPKHQATTIDSNEGINIKVKIPGKE